MGQGLPPDAPWVVFEYPLFLVDSDLSAIREKFTEIVDALTKWRPSNTATGVFNKAPVEVSGSNYEDAHARAQYLFLQKNWSDGLAIFPPTKNRVDWILAGTDHSRNETVGGGSGKVAPKQGILTYEVLAACMAMAGGRPEYMPVAEAVCKTIIEKQHTLMTSSGGAYQGICVNGPIAKQIRLNSRFSLFGPNPNHPAGGAIGRRISLVLMNVGGHVTGLAFGFCYFDHDGSVAKMPETLDGKLVDMSPMFRQPFSFIIAKIFKIKDAKSVRLRPC